MERIEQLLASIGRPLPHGEETYDLALLAGLPPDQESRARDALLEAARNGDAAAALTLGHLGGPGVVAALEPLAVGDSALARASRRSLALLGEASSEVVAGLARDATAHPSAYTRGAAGLSLALLGGESAAAASLAGLHDPDPLNRGGAFDALARLTGVEAQRWLPDGSDLNLRSPLERLRLLLSSTLEALWRPAAAELEGLFRQLAAGVPAAQLDLVYGGDPDSDLTSRVARPFRGRERTAPLPDELIGPGGIVSTAPEHDRRWAEAFIAVALTRGDARAAHALAALGATWAVPALDEVARSSGDTALIAACDAAVRALGTAGAGAASRP